MRAVAYIFLNPTSRVRLRRLLASIDWNRLFNAIFMSFFAKMPQKSRFRALRARFFVFLSVFS